MRFVRLFAAVTAAVCLISVCAAEEIMYRVGNIPYYHRDAACDFGGFSMHSSSDMQERTEITDKVGENGVTLRPCPSCASEFRPVFTGDFPEWQHDINPWELGNPDTHVSKDIRSTWGGAADAIYEIAGNGPYPEDYAGIFFNACGGYTIMMVNPTPERIEKYRQTLKSEFWVMEATYSMNELMKLQDELIHIMGFDGLTVNSLGVSVDGNCLLIGANDTSAEASRAIYAYMAMKGFDDPGMAVLEYSEGASSMDF